MKINLASTDFTLDSGSYYSSAFLQDKNDTLFTVSATFATTGTVSLQSSIDEITWSDVTDSSFTATPFAIQTYSNAHYVLVYRLKASAEPISAQILI